MNNFYYEHLILIPTVAFLVTILCKGLFFFLKNGKVNLSQALGSGGMPSVHSGVVVSLSTALALKYGIGSDYFAISMAFTVIIIYDAINVRFEAGQHAAAINKSLGQKKFKESIGHLPSEAFAGSMLGMVIALILYSL